jgi:hypothetical protein
VREIGWTIDLLIVEKRKDDLEREFYLRMSRRLGRIKSLQTLPE